MSITEPSYFSGILHTDLIVAYCDKMCSDFMGDRRHSSIPSLMTKENGDLFKAAFDMVAAGGDPEDLIVDMECPDKVFRPFHFHLSLAKEQEQTSVQFTASNIYLSEENFLRMRASFGEVIDLLEGMGYYVFKYDRKSGNIVFYGYKESKRGLIFSDTLSNFIKELYDGKVPNEDRAKAGAFQEILECPLESCSALFHTSFFSNDGLMQLMQFSGIEHKAPDGNSYTIGYVMQVKDSAPTTVFPLRDQDCDPVTGLLNKNSIIDHTQKALRALKESENIWLTICDIDDFKDVNDTYGHALGDEVIKAVARCIRDAVGEHGEVGRFGGDEYFFFVKNRGEIEIRGLFAEIKRTIEWEVTRIEPKCHITLSIGTIPAPLNGTDYDDLFNKADKGLYIAKGKGKNRFIIYREEMHGSVALPKGESEIKFEKGYSERLSVFMSNIMDNFVDNGANAIRPSLEKIKDTMELDGIRIFVGKDLKNIYTSFTDGLDEISKETAESIITSRTFDQNGLLLINRAAYIKESDPMLFDWLMERNDNSAIFYVEKDDNDEIDLLFTFEYLVKEKSKKWASADPNFILIFSRLASKIMRKFLKPGEPFP